MARPQHPDTITVGRVLIRTMGNGTFRLRWTDRDGAARQCTERDRLEAMERAVEINRTWDRKTTRVSGDDRLADVIAAAIDPAGRPGWGRRHADRLKTLARCQLIPRIGHLRCSDLHPTDWAGVLTAMADAGYAASTVKGVYDLMKLVVRWGRHAGAWEPWSEPLYGVALPKRYAGTGVGRTQLIDMSEVPTVGDCNRLTEALARHGNWAVAAELAWRTGLRWGETLAIGRRAGDCNRFDPATRLLRVDWQWSEFDKGDLALTLPKHDKRRVVVVPRDLTDRVAAALAAAADDRVLDGWLVRSPQGAPVRRSNFGRRILDEARTASGYPEHLTWHSMRHRAAVDLVHSLPLPDASKMLGHHSPAFTLARYVGADADHLDRIRNLDW